MAAFLFGHGNDNILINRKLRELKLNKVFVYEEFPDCAKEIREAVFVNEQGFHNEFDEIDNTAAHLVLFDENEVPIATCRVFWDTGVRSYIVGRVAVMKQYRGKNIGSVILQEAEKYVKQRGGKSIFLHAQCRAANFYKGLGYTEFGNIEKDEGCPHVWMQKSI